MVKRVIPGVLMSLMSQSLLVWHLLKAQLVLRVFEIYGNVSHCQALGQFKKKKEFLKLQGKGKNVFIPCLGMVLWAITYIICFHPH